jgi:hypothetical protein
MRAMICGNHFSIWYKTLLVEGYTAGILVIVTEMESMFEGNQSPPNM